MAMVVAVSLQSIRSRMVWRSPASSVCLSFRVSSIVSVPSCRPKSASATPNAATWLANHAVGAMDDASLRFVIGFFQIKKPRSYSNASNSRSGFPMVALS